MLDDELRKTFAKNLNHYLELNGYNQADLARHMKVSTASTAKWCTGQAMPRIDKIQSICNWLGIEKSELLEDNDGSSPEYYINKDAREYAEFLHKNPEYKVLFDASRKVSKDDLKTAAKILKSLEGDADE